LSALEGVERATEFVPGDSISEGEELISTELMRVGVSVFGAFVGVSVASAELIESKRASNLDIAFRMRSKVVS
jgi:hypothetical protein